MVIKNNKVATEISNIVRKGKIHCSHIFNNFKWMIQSHTAIFSERV